MKNITPSDIEILCGLPSNSLSVTVGNNLFIFNPDIPIQFKDTVISLLNSGVADDWIAVPLVVPPDWGGLIALCLGGSLYGIYSRLTAASFVNPATATIQNLSNANNIAVAAGKLDQSIQVTQVEAAVAASFQLLVNTSDYRFTEEEKALWNGVTDSLNFSNLVHLP